mmetsp:Transcript_32203/g.74954  ORF Transcript_32203/g.74954 Transcript_32203/m.74954 type:complete len:210 (+) Transcript_32203:1698-2327(+)
MAMESFFCSPPERTGSPFQSQILLSATDARPIRSSTLLTASLFSIAEAFMTRSAVLCSFSRTVSTDWKWSCCGTKAICVLKTSLVTGVPQYETEPSLLAPVRTSARVFNSVDLPAPHGPMMAVGPLPLTESRRRVLLAVPKHRPHHPDDRWQFMSSKTSISPKQPSPDLKPSSGKAWDGLGITFAQRMCHFPRTQALHCFRGLLVCLSV